MNFEAYIIILMCLVFINLIVLLLSIKASYKFYYKEIPEMMSIKIKYLRPIKPIDVIDKGDWIDLRCGIDIELDAGQYYCLPLGVAMELPRGYSAIIVPRSSTFMKWGILQANSVGVIDNSYCGENDEWKLPVLAMRKTRIHMNDRICQFTLIPQLDEFEFVRVKTLGNADRKGFGSTGYE